MLTRAILALLLVVCCTAVETDARARARGLFARAAPPAADQVPIFEDQTYSSTGVPNSIYGMSQGTGYQGNTLTYSFPTIAGCTPITICHFTDPAFEGINGSLIDPTEDFKTTVRYGLAQWTACCNVYFTEVTESASVWANIRFLNSNNASYFGSIRAFTTAPVWPLSNANTVIWFRNNDGAMNSPSPGQTVFTTPAHEIGHKVFGWKHPDEDYNIASPGFLPMSNAIDFRGNTVMSQKSSLGVGIGLSGSFYPTNLGVLDINAAHWFFPPAKPGTLNQVHTWSTTTGMHAINGVDQFYKNPLTNTIYMTVCDISATASFDTSNYTTNQTIDIRPSGPWPPTIAGQPSPGVPPTGWSTFNSAQVAQTDPAPLFAPGNVQVCAAQGAFIKNVTTGSGNDVIRGNAINNQLDGGSGTDKVIFVGNRSDYTVVIFNVSDCQFTSTAEGVDRLLFIEQVEFADVGVKTLNSSCTVSP